LVALDAPLGPRTSAWARSILDALEPTLAWGVVEASRKPEDLAAWADMLGGLDVLAVNGAADSVTPESVLRLGVPVGRLDGAAATRSRWAEIVSPAIDAAPEFEALDAPVMAVSA
jgi:hypothetical protein